MIIYSVSGVEVIIPIGTMFLIALSISSISCIVCLMSQNIGSYLLFGAMVIAEVVLATGLVGLLLRSGVVANITLGG